MSPRTVFLLASKEIRDSRRNRWFIVTALLFAALASGVSLLGMLGLGSIGVAGFGRTSASLINLVLIIVPLMGLLTGAVSLASEKEQGTLCTLLAQPVSASEIFVGKYLGAAAVTVAAVLIGFGASGFVISRYAGNDRLPDYLLLVGFTVLLSVAFVGAGFLTSAFANKTSSAAGAAVFFWFAFIFLSDLGLMGTAVALRLEPPLLFWMSVLNPAQCFKLAVLGSLQGSLEVFGPSGAYASGLFGNALMPFFAAVMAFWIVAAPAAALWGFKKRCAAQ